MGETAQSTIRLLIETSADTAAIKRAAEAVESVGEAAGRAGAASGSVEAAIAKLERTAPEAAASVQKLKTAVQSVEREMGKQVVTSGAGEKAHDAEAKAKFNSAQASQALGRGFQDLQGGVGGVLNNIEQLVMGLGGGAGLAGVLTLVSTALYFLGPPLWNLITGEDEAAKKAAKLAGELSAAEAEAYRLAAGADASRESVRRHEEAMQSITDGFQGYITAVERAIRVREQFRRMQLEEGDAKAANELAKIDQAEKSGRLSPQDAERARSGVAVASEERRAAAEQQRLDEQRALRETESAGKAAQAAKLDAERKRLEQAGGGLTMSAEDIKAAKAANEDSKARIEELKKQAQEAQNQIGALKQRTGFNPAADAALQPTIDKLAERADNANRRAAEEQGRIRDRDAQMKRNQIAQEDTGIESPEALRKRVAELQKEAADARQKAQEAEAEVRVIQSEKGSAARTSMTRRETMGIQSVNRILDLDRADAERAAKAEERAQREAERQSRRGQPRGQQAPATSVPGGGGMDRYDRGAEADMIEQLRGFVQAGGANAEAMAALAGEIKTQTAEMRKKTAAAAASVRDGR